MRKIILFDLDGTLIESGEGIIKSLQYAIKEMKLLQKTAEELNVFIGPPLLEQLMSYFDLTEAEGERAVKLYHDRYHPIGLFESEPYQGIEEMLVELKQQGFVLGISSSKPDYLVKEVLTHYNLSQYFSVIMGSGEGKIRNTKASVIKATLSELNVSKEVDQVWMVGDKEHDVLGAREEDIPCIGVLYGYGTKEEMECVQPFKMVDSVSELKDYLISL